MPSSGELLCHIHGYDVDGNDANDITNLDDNGDASNVNSNPKK